ncbi:MAG: glutaredoxin domain-containing protein [Candidatus Neomarinimicrobiota bacterium]|nr:glutaredoxin domain-containing protein [Candidatus Neomarinimicrobiota bacterium]
MKQLVKIYSASWCQPCKSAKRLLTERGLKYEEIDIEERGWSREDLFDLTGGRTVPQIVIDGKPVGGYDELLKLDHEGKLNG